jgi:hypothetical protein
MNKRYLALAVVALLLSQVVGVAAHHAFSAVYDEKKTITIDGVVTQFRFVNPHALMSVEVKDKAGKVVTWTVEFAGRLTLTERGWTAETVKAGERVKVTGNPAWKSTQQMAFQRIVKADGTTLEQVNAARITAIEEERRERAAKRGQAK